MITAGIYIHFPFCKNKCNYCDYYCLENRNSDIGFFVETLFIVPITLIFLYFIVKNDLNDFQFSNPDIMFWLFLAGPVTLIPLYLYLRGVHLAGLGTSGMIFFITPTCQFLLGFFYFDEVFHVDKLIGFIFIWFAVIIYLRDLNQEI